MWHPTSGRLLGYGDQERVTRQPSILCFTVIEMIRMVVVVVSMMMIMTIIMILMRMVMMMMLSFLTPCWNALTYNASLPTTKNVTNVKKLQLQISVYNNQGETYSLNKYFPDVRLQHRSKSKVSFRELITYLQICCMNFSLWISLCLSNWKINNIIHRHITQFLRPFLWKFSES